MSRNDVLFGVFASSHWNPCTFHKACINLRFISCHLFRFMVARKTINFRVAASILFLRAVRENFSEPWIFAPKFLDGPLFSGYFHISHRSSRPILAEGQRLAHSLANYGLIYDFGGTRLHFQRTLLEFRKVRLFRTCGLIRLQKHTWVSKRW